MDSILNPSQHCGIRGHTIFKAIANIRDTAAYAEYSGSKLCIVSLDFKSAFDNITHSYLFTLLETYGFSTQIRKYIQDMYTNVTSSVMINGHTSRPIPIKCAVRQGCPLNTQLFAIYLDPLITNLEKVLTPVHIGRRTVQTTVLAYTDDVTLIVTSPHDIPKIKQALDHYAAASGARINIQNSKAMAVGSWDTAIDILDIKYHTEMKILGTHFTATVRQSTYKSWSAVTGRIRSMARDAYYRELCFDKRILYVHNYLLGAALYTAQIFPMPDVCIRQVNSAIAWYIWRGDIFRVPLSTLQQQKWRGGWDFLNVAAKSRALFFHRLWRQSKDAGSLTSERLRKWNLTAAYINPPHIRSNPATLDYMRQYAKDTARIAPQEQSESNVAYKRRIYNTMSTLFNTTTDIPEMRIVRL